MDLASKYEGIVVTSKQEYSCAQKLLCCKCLPCMQEERVMTSDIRKQTIQRMIEDYMINEAQNLNISQDELLMDPVKLMILIYVCNDDTIPNKHIEKCKINPSTGVINYRTDLEFYIPQLCNYIVFYRSLQPNYLRDAIEQMCKLNYYFAHLYYFYMKSLEKNITKNQIQVLKPVIDYNQKFVKEMGFHYEDVKLTCLDLYIDQHSSRKHSDPDQYTRNVIYEYETSKLEYGKLTKVKGSDIVLNKYRSIFEGQTSVASSFESAILFFEDLFLICEELKKFEKKKEKVIEYVKMINENLPSTAYIPFSKNSYRLCNVLKIVTSEVKVFSTKERAPVCLCIQTYCPAEELDKDEEEKFWTNVETPITLRMMTFSNRSLFFARNFERTAQFRRHRQSSAKFKSFGTPKNILEQERIANQEYNAYCLRDDSIFKFQSQPNKIKIQMKEIPATSDPNQFFIETQRVSFGNSTKRTNMNGDNAAQLNLEKIEQVQKENTDKTKSSNQKNYEGRTKKYINEAFDKMFGEPLKKTKERIAKNSVFGNIRSWDILYIIIKTHDDLKQEEFAMQLIQQFDYIFKLEQLPLMITTYEVLSMGADRGIIEMVKDSVTFDSLQKTLKTGLPMKLTLKQFFQIYFQNLAEAKQNFLKSLAAYSLVMYIIQAKDRHNGNILLHRSGKMFHIDFGFFLSNMPGKGIQLERDCPFKLLTEHVDVLDGINSHYFKKFRQYFFLGFKAIRKHQNKVLMLVKLMYSTSGMTMPCFIKGQATITAMEARINPPGITNDSLLNEHCQNLINLSLDNWASKWYDRFQYWAQGIFY